MTMKLTRLFTPIKIGKVELRNRIAMLPMGTAMADKDGYVTDRQIAYYTARAKGGVGLIITEYSVAHHTGKIPHLISLYNDSYIPGWKKLADSVHAHGAKIFPQLAHGGRQTRSEITGSPLLAASAIPCPMMKEVPKELTQLEIADIVDGFAEAARRAQEAGCDGVEIHGAHGYLVCNFMSPLTNRRVDEYGGTLRGRLRFPSEIIAAIKSKCGSDFPVAFRFCSDEMVPGGIVPEEATLIAAMLADAGADMIDISRANYGSFKWLFPVYGTPLALNAGFTEKLKQALALPILLGHRINDPFVAENVLAHGQADLVGMGRALIADAELPRKAQEGRFEDISPCIGCNQGCLARAVDFLPITCAINPMSGRELELPLIPAKKQKKVLVVGGGLAGMEAARVAAQRGHDVTLYEKSSRLGGQFSLASVPPHKQEFTRVVSYLVRQLKSTGVRVVLGAEATPATVEHMKCDTVIVASGAVPIVPTSIPGTNKPVVSSANDVLGGKTPIGEKVVVVGGGMVGCEVAEYAKQAGATEVTVLEMLPAVASDLAPIWSREFLLERLEKFQVNLCTSAMVKEVLDDGVAYTKNGSEYAIRGVSNVILAVGGKSFDPLSQELSGKVPELYVIGDAKQVRRAADAIEEGTRIARQI
ncbi:MAG: FAD-dependent oxidoreductase [Terriglobales bacterium]